MAATTSKHAKARLNAVVRDEDGKYVILQANREPPLEGEHEIGGTGAATGTVPVEWTAEPVVLKPGTGVFMAFFPSGWTNIEVMSELDLHNAVHFQKSFQGASTCNGIDIYDKDNGDIVASSYKDDPASCCTPWVIMNPSGQIGMRYKAVSGYVPVFDRRTSGSAVKFPDQLSEMIRAQEVIAKELKIDDSVIVKKPSVHPLDDVDKVAKSDPKPKEGDKVSESDAKKKKKKFSWMRKAGRLVFIIALEAVVQFLTN